MSDTMQKTRWFWAWQDDKEEAWLEEMSQQGWHLSEVGIPTQYTFRAGEPRRYAYRLDFITTAKKDLEGYYQLFRDAGWEHMGQMSGWQYWRKEVTAEEMPEIYTDVESKVRKYQRLLGYLAILFPIWMVFFLNSQHLDYGVFGEIVSLLYMVLMAIYAFCVIKLIRRIRELRRL